MQGSRLFQIVYYLLDRGGATAGELAEKFEVSVRTIYRDIDALSGAGIPIYTEAGRKGGVRLMKDFVLDKALLSETEKQEIVTALQSINATRYVDYNDILGKLSALFHMDSKSWLEVDFSRWGDKQKDNQKFELLKAAVIYHKSVKIRYAGSCEEIRDRVIQPLKLVYKSMAWYLKAYCAERQDYRIFKLTRILKLEVLEDSFTPFSFPEQKSGREQEYTQMTLCFPKEMAYRVYDEFDETQVKRQADGDFLVSVQMPEDAWLIGFLLSFGTQVEIIEPARLRETVREQARLIYEKNKP